MNLSRACKISAIMLAGLTISGCKGASEPALPTSDPLDRIRLSEGWKVGKGIAVSPGPKAHHMQAITFGTHNVDFKTPPAQIKAVEPKCNITKPGMGSKKYLVVASGATNFPLMRNAEPRTLMVFNDEDAKSLASQQADTFLEKGVRTTNALGSISGAFGTPMGMQDIVITDTEKPVFVALSGNKNILYNFNMAPDVVLSGVVVYTDSHSSAVAGVPDNIPVEFITSQSSATKRCWKRVQTRPDDSWAKAKSRARDKRSRYNAVMPHWKAFHKKVQSDVGRIPNENIVSVNAAGHILLGPVPTNYEDRVIYTGLGGKTIRYATGDHVQFGTREENYAYSRAVLDKYYKAFVNAGS